MLTLKIIKKATWLIVAVIIIQGCTTTKPLFYWGEYETLIHDMYLRPGDAPPRVQIEKLTADIQKAESRGLPVAPGVYAHLGFMYAMEGKVVDAEAALQQEIALFPESRTLIEAMLRRARTTFESEGAIQ